jgi:glycosyltransferase involved in cell wall biosynthesis
MSQHLVFTHYVYPGQFGPIVKFLLDNHDVRVSFFSEVRASQPDPRIQYYPFAHVRPVPKLPEEFFSRYFVRDTQAALGVYEAFEAAKLKDPACIVGYTQFGNMTLLHTAYPDIPKIGYFEVFIDPQLWNREIRPGRRIPIPFAFLESLRNARVLQELEECSKGYSPTHYQKSTYPKTYHPKLQVLFDGIDADLYKPGPASSNCGFASPVPKGAKLVTFASPRLELYRGFDVFMEMALLICAAREDVHFAVAGLPGSIYGPDAFFYPNATLKDSILSQPRFDRYRDRFQFTGWLSERALSDLFRLSDCHFYWTEPFTVSWSLFQAMSTGCAVVSSDSAPVRELIRNGQNGLLFDPCNAKAIAELVLNLLEAPDRRRELGNCARETILKQYSFEACLPKLAEFLLS